MEKNDIMINKYRAVFILHALGDTIGFKNGDWEFNVEKNGGLESVLEFVYEFINLGGINGIDLKGWRVSDDTLYHLAIASSLFYFDNKLDDKLILQMKNLLILTHNRILHEEIDESIKRFPGNATEKNIQNFSDDSAVSKYDSETGGNGAAMRNLCIGLAFHKKEHLNMLIDVSIVSSKLTHGSPLGFLAGLTSAYFVHMAINSIHIWEWAYNLIKLLNSDDVKKHIDMKNNEEIMDYMAYIKYWQQYIDIKFNKDKKPLDNKIFSNLVYRIKMYYENFVENSKTRFIGGSGFCAMIMAYDSLLDCGGNWEKLVFYSMLHIGDSDTVGAIAGGLFGAVYGFSDVPKKMLDNIEEKEYIDICAEQFFHKYYLNENIAINKKIVEYNKRHNKRH